MIYIILYNDYKINSNKLRIMKNSAFQEIQKISININNEVVYEFYLAR
jgi:hypothetical protein